MDSNTSEKNIESIIDGIKQGKNAQDLAQSLNMEGKETKDIEQIFFAIKKEASAAPSADNLKNIINQLPENEFVTKETQPRLNKQEALFDKFNNFVQETMSLKTLSYALASIIIIFSVIFLWATSQNPIVSFNNQPAAQTQLSEETIEQTGDPDQEFDLLLASISDEEMIIDQELQDDFGLSEIDSELNQIETIYEEI